MLAEEQADDFKWDMESEHAVVMDKAHFTWERTVTQDSEKDGPHIKQQVETAKKAHKAEKAALKAGKSSLEGDGADSASTLTTTEPFKLHCMDFNLGRNELVAVIGGVGSGKSSLLAALAGEMRRTEGQITMGASRAFCPQYAWIQNATVRDNIVFGKEYQRRWYDEVVDACALRPDLVSSLKSPLSLFRTLSKVICHDGKQIILRSHDMTWPEPAFQQSNTDFARLLGYATAW